MAETIDIDQYTAQIVPNTKTTISNQYFDLNQPFAFPRYGNQCTAYTSGRDYMKAVADAIRAAQSFIMITGWQLDYDVELDNRGDPRHPGRLSELLADAIQRGVHIRVMLYDSFERQLDTHDDRAQAVLNDLPKGKGSIAVLLANPNTTRSSAMSQVPHFVSGGAADTNAFFSHHQKSVVIDGQVAFVGGIDLAYGRWDTHAFDVVLDRRLHVINDGYNMQLSCSRRLTKEEQDLTDARSGRPGFAHPYRFAYEERLLDESQLPRQPWEDVSVKIAGPSAFDVFNNFVLRWNSFAGSGTNVFDAGMDANWFERAGGPSHLIDPLQRGGGVAAVQICRSASSKQLGDELVLWDNLHKYVNDDWKSPDPTRKKIVQSARRAWSGGHQTSIRDAMINCIRSAQAFVYIENQFFMSACGVDRHGTPSPATNPIIAELANAIGRAIYADRPFHVYLVLPEHPEGHLEDDGTRAQGWWALQGILHGNNSLIHRINATLLAKYMKGWGLAVRPSSNSAILEQLSAHGMGEKWKDYLTVLNLRNYGHTATHVVTEMIYVHSKLTIVDDAVAIIGSANINDRSLNGNGDTEIAAVVVDENSRLVDVGAGVNCVTRQFASHLRKRLFRKHLGALVDQSTTGVTAQGVPAGIDIEKPLAPGTIKGIRQLATINRETYSEVFLHTPRDEFKTLAEGRQFYKVAYRDRNGQLREIQSFSVCPPLQPAFMTASGSHDINRAMQHLRKSVRGFWVSMPLYWGSGESHSPKLPANSPQSIAQIEESKEKGLTNVG